MTREQEKAFEALEDGRWRTITDVAYKARDGEPVVLGFIGSGSVPLKADIHAKCREQRLRAQNGHLTILLVLAAFTNESSGPTCFS